MLLALVAAPAAAKIVTYPVPTAGSSPFAFTTAFDNASWFTDVGTDKVGRIDSMGAVTELALPAGAKPLGITPTAFGTLAIAANGTKTIDELAPDGTVTVHPLPSGLAPYDVGLGPDSRIWFTGQLRPETPGMVGALDFDGTVATASLSGEPWGLTRGDDGNLWVAERTPTAGAIARVTREGTVTEFATGAASLPLDVSTGGDGNVWFTDQAGGKVGRVTPAGKVTLFALGASDTVFGIAKFGEGGVLVADTGGHALYAVRNSGKAHRVAVGGAPVHVDLRYPNGMYFTLQDGRIGRIDDGDLIAACRVPKVVGRKLAAARRLIAAAECAVGRIVRRRHRGPKGVVLRQSPLSGQKFTPGREVDLTVSRH